MEGAIYWFRLTLSLVKKNSMLYEYYDDISTTKSAAAEIQKLMLTEIQVARLETL